MLDEKFIRYSIQSQINRAKMDAVDELRKKWGIHPWKIDIYQAGQTVTSLKSFQQFKSDKHYYVY